MKKTLLIHFIFVIIDVTILLISIFVNTFSTDKTTLPPYVIPEGAIADFDLAGYQEFQLQYLSLREYTSYSAELVWEADTITYKTYSSMNSIAVDYWQIIEENELIGTDATDNSIYAPFPARVIETTSSSVRLLNLNAYSIRFLLPQDRFNLLALDIDIDAVFPNKDKVPLELISHSYTMSGSSVYLYFKPIETYYNVLKGVTGVKVYLYGDQYTASNYFLPTAAFSATPVSDKYYSFIRKDYSPSTASFTYTSLNLRAGKIIGDYTSITNYTEECTIIIKK